MAWLTPEQKKLFWQFLEPNPPKNRVNNLGIRELSFYSSELKNVSQIIEQLTKIRAGTFGDAGDAKTHRRYLNTLSHLGLVIQATHGPELLDTADEILSLTDNHPHLLEPEHREALTQSVDQAIFDSLLRGFRSSPTDANPDSEEAFFPLRLHNAQVFLESIPEDIRGTVVDDLDFLFVLSCIYSAGFEVERFFRLNASQRTEALQAYNECTGTLPNKPPNDPIEALTHFYLEPIANNRIQKDIRYRIHAFLRAYMARSQELGEAFPRFDNASRLINHQRVQTAYGTGASLDFQLPTPEVELPQYDFPRQWLINGCPGSGKSRYLEDHASALKQTKVIRTTFHAETSYFDFVGAYKPTPIFEPTSSALTDSQGNPFSKGRPLITYEFTPGPLVEALAYAALNPHWTIILIVEELNRANTSAVFGDFFQLLDRDADTGHSRFPIRPQPELSAFLDHLGLENPEHLLLPSNLYVWATMNNADQGVFPLDSAFRRRWEFRYRGHATPCEYEATERQLTYGNEQHDWDVFRRSINQILIQEGVHEDKLIGPYFLTPAELASPTKVLYKLFLYLWDDALRFQHRTLMDFGSFDELEQAWADGQGAPLSGIN